jgi:Na+/H+ antiporter NhaD/arsenite permease-like protein
MPLTRAPWKHHWESFYPYVSIGLALVVTCVYARVQANGLHGALESYHDYASFILLIGALYVIAGGIRIDLAGEATPAKNVLFLLGGAVLANVIGTTGASMLLIRPWLRWNKARVSGYHVVFFIFTVSNIGGGLTPIGDPPLFLGYLLGVPFFWLITHLWSAWALAMGLVLTAFYVFDLRRARSFAHDARERAIPPRGAWRIQGSWNALLLAVVVGALFLPAVPWLREGVMGVAIVLSVALTDRDVWRRNHFSFRPIKEIALLFFGIFGTIAPVLDFMSAHAGALGLTHPLQYYFASGLTSSVLDNAPTYSSFFELAKGTALAQFADAQASLTDPMSHARFLLAHRPDYVAAISLGAVFFGALTYIGNGPNLMVKTIADEAGVACPSFFAYSLRYAVPILLPVLALVGLFTFAR